MNLAAALDPVPLVATDDGEVFRVTGTRVTLDTAELRREIEDDPRQQAMRQRLLARG